jgi:hypothetical protein
MWFTNYDNSSIGRITPSGAISNYTGSTVSSPEGITAGPDGGVWFTNTGNNSIGRIQASQAAETPQELCELTVGDVEGSARYQALPTFTKNVVNQILTSACNQLGTITPKLSARQLTQVITTYKAAVTVLAAGGWLTSAQASSLTSLAGNISTS